MTNSANNSAWIEARKRHRLTDAHVQMARELGMNPKKLGKIDNHKQEPWKAPLPEFIESLYAKRFGKTRPDVVKSVEARAKDQQAKKDARKERRRQERENGTSPASPEARSELDPDAHIFDDF